LQLPVLNELLEAYRIKVYENGYETQYIHLQCAYDKAEKKSTGLMAFTNKILKPLGIKITNA
jgi:hypothetical protein